MGFLQRFLIIFCYLLFPDWARTISTVDSMPDYWWLFPRKRISRFDAVFLDLFRNESLY